MTVFDSDGMGGGRFLGYYLVWVFSGNCFSSFYLIKLRNDMKHGRERGRVEKESREREKVKRKKIVRKK